MWIILDAKEGSYINLGFNQDVKKEEFPKLIKDDSILSYLNKIYVKPGDIYLIKPGTIHAIGEGITLLEIQESSKLTYRVYDFNRIDKNGNKRELHISKAMDVLNFSKLNIQNLNKEEVIKTNYFEVYKGKNLSENKIDIIKPSIITIIEGNGFIDETEVSKFKSYFVLPCEKLKFCGGFEYFVTTI